MRVTDISVTVVEVPQIPPVAPYRSHLRTSSTTRSAIVRVETDEGLTGWGEHNVNFLPDVSARRLEQQARAWLIGKDPHRIEEYHQSCPFESRLKSGIEIALWDIRGQAAGVPIAVLLGGIVRSRISVAACMGIQPYERAGEIAAMYVEQGFSTLKTKAGSSMQEDLDMVRGIRDAVGDKLMLRIDANCAYSLREALELARQLEPYRLEYLEQPIAADPLSDARRLREETSVPIALNESVIGPDSVREILREQAADFVLPDTHIAGGMLPCREIGELCAAASIPCIMHCGHDLGLKTAAMLHVAAACPTYSLANDTTYYGLEDDIVIERLTIESGTIALPDRPGLGVQGDPEKIAWYRIDC